MSILIERIKYNYKMGLHKTKTKIKIYLLKEDEFITLKNKKQLINLLNQIKWMPIFRDDGWVEYIHTYNQWVVKKIHTNVHKLNDNYKED